MMIKRLSVIAALCAVGVLASACNKTTGGNAPVPPPTTSAGQQAAEVIGKVQNTATKICGYVPTAQTVANILSALGVNSLSGLTDVAAQICSVVERSKPKAAHPLARKAAPPSVAGVPIRGHFVR